MAQKSTEFYAPDAGKINYIVARFPDPPASGVTDPRSPYPFIKELLRCTKPSVPNAYEVEGNRFLYKFQMHSVLSKAACTLQNRGNFTVTLDEQPFVLLGINYAGKLRVEHGSGEKRVILLPGWLTYDPAGVTGDPVGCEFIGKEAALYIQSIVASQVKSALEGATEPFMETLRKVTEDSNKLYIHRPYLLWWMTEQVTFACFPKPGIQRLRSYAEFLIDKVNREELSLSEKGRGHTKEYLEWYLRINAGKVTEKEMHPPYQYYFALRHYLRPDDLQEVAGDNYSDVLEASDQNKKGQGVFLFYLPQRVRVTKSDPKPSLSFEELRRKCEFELQQYQSRLKQVDEEVITEVEVMRQSERQGQKCQVF